METSPRSHHHHHHYDNQNPQQSLLPSPTSHSSTTSSTSSSSNNSNGLHHHPNSNTNNNRSLPPTPPPTTPPALPSPRPITRSESTNPYPTTFVQADTSSFKQVVQMLTGSPKTTNTTTQQPDASPRTHTHHHHHIPPIKSMPKKTSQSSSSGFKLYERRNSLKNLKINPLNPIFAPPNSGFSPRKPEILSPSIPDFHALVLSPVTPLIPDPFDRSGLPSNYANCFSPVNINNNKTTTNNNNKSVDGNVNVNNLIDAEAEEKAIKEKGFYLHPSPATTPREPEPRLLPLFPATSPRVSGSANDDNRNTISNSSC